MIKETADKLYLNTSLGLIRYFRKQEDETEEGLQAGFLLNLAAETSKKS